LISVGDHRDRPPPAGYRCARNQPFEAWIVITVGEEIFETGTDQASQIRHARRLRQPQGRAQRLEDQRARHCLILAAQGPIELDLPRKLGRLLRRQAPEDGLELRGLIHAPVRVEE